MELEKSYGDFIELDLWKIVRGLKKDIFELVKKFPAEERYRLSDQMIRCSRSINANIAEGHGRYSFKDQLHFCIVSRGSFSELRNHFYDALDCNYITKEEFLSFEQRILRCVRVLNGYIQHLRKKLQ